MSPSRSFVEELFRKGAWCDRCAETPRLFVRQDPADMTTVVTGHHHGQVEQHVVADEIFMYGGPSDRGTLRALLMFFWRGFFSYPRRPAPRARRTLPAYARRRERVRARKMP